jgi:hypothetical protein
VRGVLIFEPPFADLMWAEGVWCAINDECGAELDEYEDEDIPPERVACAASVVAAAVRRISGSGRSVIRHEIGTIRTQVGTAADGEVLFTESPPMMAVMDKADVVAKLERLVEFLREAAAERKLVVVEL